MFTLQSPEKKIAWNSPIWLAVQMQESPRTVLRARVMRDETPAPCQSQQQHWYKNDVNMEHWHDLSASVTQPQTMTRPATYGR